MKNDHPLAPRRLLLRGMVGAALLLPIAARDAAAATFTVNPTQVRLSARTTSGLVTLRNRSEEPLRFEVRAFKWDQSADGEMLLEPTREVVAFPALFTVAPGEQRTIRVGFTGARSALETSYRIFVEELPPPPGSVAGGVRMLTRMGIPVFVEPSAPKPRLVVSTVHVEGARAAFTVRNLGNVHALPQRIRVVTMDKSGVITFDRDLPTWYVLAGGARRYFIDLPASACVDLVLISATLEVPGMATEERVATASCGV